MNTLAQFGSHAWIHFHYGGLFGLFEDANGQITCTWTDFENHVRWFEVGLVDNTLRHERILEDMLAELVRVEDGVLGGGTRVLVGCVNRAGAGCS